MPRLRRPYAENKRTREYVRRRTEEGKSKREIMRCLKRYVVRQVYCALLSTAATPSPIGTSPGL